jgi:hypothetical protein
MWEWSYSSTILDLGTKMEVTDELHSRYPLDRRLGGPQSRFGRCGEKKNIAVPEVELESSSP